MKKRILCMLLALLMAVSLIPGPAFAAGEETSYDFSSDVGRYVQLIPNPEDVETGGIYTVSEGLGGEEWNLSTRRKTRGERRRYGFFQSAYGFRRKRY